MANSSTKVLTLADLRLKPDERGAILGMTGCGKTELARHILPAKGKLGIVDPKRLFDAKWDIPIYNTAWKIKLLKPDRFIFRPNEDAINDIRQYNEVYEYIYKRGNGVGYTDDVVGIMDVNRYPHYFQVCYQMGRQKHVAMLSAFQRPSRLPLWLCSEANKFYAFHLTLSQDIKRVQEFCGKAYDPEALDKYQFFFRDITTMKDPEVTKLNLGGK